MSEETPNRELPEDIKPTINSLRALAFIELRNGNYKGAEKIYLRELAIINRKEQERQAAIHKGATYYNLGVSRLFQNNTKPAAESILLAYIEDLFNVQPENEKAANGDPAFKMLTTLFRHQQVHVETN